MELVTLSEKGNPITSSKKVAKKFGKRHADIMRKIEQLELPEEWRERNFALTLSIRQLGTTARQDKEYLMTRDGFTVLVMSMTGKKAIDFKLEYMAAFNAMEKALTEQAHLSLSDDKLEEILRLVKPLDYEDTLQQELEMLFKWSGRRVTAEVVIDRFGRRLDFMSKRGKKAVAYELKNANHTLTEMDVDKHCKVIHKKGYRNYIESLVNAGYERIEFNFVTHLEPTQAAFDKMKDLTIEINKRYESKGVEVAIKQIPLNKIASELWERAVAKNSDNKYFEQQKQKFPKLKNII